MTAPEFFFFIFATITVLSAVMVISSRNPIHSVLFLILAFLNSSGLFLIAGAEFLALLLAIVYVGAVAVLFLFVVMMLNINFARLREGMAKSIPIGASVGAILLVELILVLGAYGFRDADHPVLIAQPIAESGPTNTHALGSILYTEYVYLFQGAGMILLVAMIGAIVLTLRQREGVKKQSVPEQIARRREKTVELVKIKPGQGMGGEV